MMTEGQSVRPVEFREGGEKLCRGETNCLRSLSGSAVGSEDVLLQSAPEGSGDGEFVAERCADQRVAPSANGAWAGGLTVEAERKRTRIWRDSKGRRGIREI